MNKQEQKAYDIMTLGWRSLYAMDSPNLPLVMGKAREVDYVIAAKLHAAFPKTMFILTREVTKQVLDGGALESRLEITWMPLPDAPGAQAVDTIVSKEFNGIFYKNSITYRADT